MSEVYFISRIEINCISLGIAHIYHIDSDLPCSRQVLSSILVHNIDHLLNTPLFLLLGIGDDSLLLSRFIECDIYLFISLIDCLWL